MGKEGIQSPFRCKQVFIFLVGKSSSHHRQTRANLERNEFENLIAGTSKQPGNNNIKQVLM